MKHSLLKILLATSFASAATLAFANTASAKERIGVTIYKYDDNFMGIFRRDMQAEAKVNYKNLDLLLNDSQNSQAEQNNQVDVLIAKGVKVLAINLVDPSAAPTIIAKAKLANIPVVFFNKDPGQAAINSYDKAYFVGTNPEESGRIQGDLIAKYWSANHALDKNHDGVIQYVLLKGEPGHPDAEARTKYVIEELKEKGLKVEQLRLDTAMWDTAQAKDKMDAWLSSPDASKIELVIANNDAMAMGAIQAEKEHGFSIPTFGVDALPEALSLIKTGQLTGTVLNDAKSQASAVLAFVNNLATGKDATAGTSYKLISRFYRVPYVGVNLSNLDKFYAK